jgi:hypothetical protein
MAIARLCDGCKVELEYLEVGDGLEDYPLEYKKENGWGEVHIKLGSKLDLCEKCTKRKMNQLARLANHDLRVPKKSKPTLKVAA